jgi:methionyl-tRNA formyltransferase
VRIVFAGTPEFSVAALDALIDAGHELVGVFTQPDRAAGRGQKLKSSPVAARATELLLPVFKPEKLRGDAVEQLRALVPDVMVVVAYGLILPQSVLDIPARGCLNIHASLLPRWRGAAPIQRAILAGDRQSGVTIMRMNAGLDTGPMLLHEAVAIDDDTTAASLHDALSAIGARLIVDALRGIEAGTLTATPQPDGATYAPKLSKDEARIDWNRSAVEIARAVRAYDPFPVAWTELDGERVRIHEAQVTGASGDAAAGAIVGLDNTGLLVSTREGTLAIKQLQWPGGRVLTAREAAAGRELSGQRFS